MVNIEVQCWGEKQGIRGCASCLFSKEWLQFLRGDGLTEECRPKMERIYGKENVALIDKGEATINPMIAIINL